MDSTTTSADTNNNLSHSSDELPHDNDVNEEVHRVSFNGPSFASCPVNLDLAGVEVIEMNEMKNIKVTGKKQEDKETGETIMMENIEVMTNENQNKKEDLWELDMLENGIITEKNKHDQERKGQDEIVYVNESALEIKLSKEDERQVNKDEDVKTQMEASEGCHTVHGEENEVKKGADVTDTTETGDMEEDESERNRDLDFPKEISDREHLEPFEEVVEDDSSAEEESESSSDPGEHPLLESPSPEPIHSASDHDEHPLENPSAPEPIHNASDPDEHPLSAAAPQQEPIYYASAGGCVTLTYHPPPTSLENVPVFPDDLDDEDGNVLYCPVELQEGRIVARLGPDRVLIIDLNDDVNPDEERRTDTEEGEPQDQGEDDEAEDNEDDKEHEEDQDDETSGSEEENSEDDSDRAQDEDEEDSQKEDEDKDDESDETSGSEDDNDKAQDEDEEDNQKEDENKDDEKDETNGSEDENTENDNDKGQNEDEEDHQKEDDEHNWCKKREEDDSEDKTAEDTEAKEHAEGEGEDEEEGQNVFFSCDDLTDDDVLEVSNF